MTPVTTPNAATLPVQCLPVNQLTVLPEDRPRSGCCPPHSAAFNELTESIKRNGLRSPIYGRLRGTKSGSNSAEIVSGHYRYWAAVALGHLLVPVVYVADRATATEHLVATSGKRWEARSSD